MRGRGSRRWTALVIALTAGSVFFIAPGTNAGAPNNFSDNQVSMFCEEQIQSALGTVLGLSADASEAFGEFAGLDFWAPGTSPENDPPTLRTNFDLPADVTADADSIDADIPLIDASSGEPAGVASLSASLVLDGDPSPIESDFRDGNRLFRQSGTFQPALASGTVTLPGVGTFTFSDCSAFIMHVDIFETNPDTFAVNNSGFFVDCQLQTDDGFVALGAVSDQGSFIEVTFLPAAGGLISGGVEDANVSTSGISETIPLHSESEGGGDAGVATVEATFTPGERVAFSTSSSTSKIKSRGRLYDVAGTLTFSEGGEEFDLADCTAIDVDDHVRQHSPKGPKPGGKPPVNDLPANALALVAGASVRQPTGGAAETPEAPCIIVDEGGEFEVPIGRTVWYTIVGTGGDVTLDSSGSDFDTVLGVYSGDGSLAPIVCVDDIPRDDFGFSLQSILTFPTEPGVTYFVQAGGFGSEFGTLRLTVR